MNNSEKTKVFLCIAAVFILIAGVFILPAWAEETPGKHDPVPEGKIAAMQTVSTLEDRHYSKPVINDDISKTLFGSIYKKVRSK